MSTVKIFYSWQSDHPSILNMDFIEGALREAAQSIVDDSSIEVEPVIDRDTSGVPGSPDIAKAIFEKIDESYVFVCDVSIINSETGSRPTPNPNVLIELGYALRSMGYERVVMVMNTAYGRTTLLPFDLRNKRVMTYSADPASNNHDSSRAKLIEQLTDALRLILTTLEAKPTKAEIELSVVNSTAQQSISDRAPLQQSKVKEFAEHLIAEIEDIPPTLSDETVDDEMLLDSLEASAPLVLEFSSLVNAIAANDSLDASIALFESFGLILDRYRPPLGFSGTWRDSDFDFFKFLGHELFVTFISSLIRHNRWSIITDILRNEIFVENTPRGGPGLLPYTRISEYVAWLAHRNQRLELRRVSLHADLLNERHTEGSLAGPIPMRDFMDADYLLFLREGLAWRAWSTLYMGNRPPRYIVEAETSKNAQRLLGVLQVDNVSSLREWIVSRTPELGQLFRHRFGSRPLDDFDLSRIGTK